MRLQSRHLTTNPAIGLVTLPQQYNVYIIHADCISYRLGTVILYRQSKSVYLKGQLSEACLSGEFVVNTERITLKPDKGKRTVFKRVEKSLLQGNDAYVRQSS